MRVFSGGRGRGAQKISEQKYGERENRRPGLDVRVWQTLAEILLPLNPANSDFQKLVVSTFRNWCCFDCCFDCCARGSVAPQWGWANSAQQQQGDGPASSLGCVKHGHRAVCSGDLVEVEAVVDVGEVLGDGVVPMGGGNTESAGEPVCYIYIWHPVIGLPSRRG